MPSCQHLANAKFCPVLGWLPCFLANLTKSCQLLATFDIANCWLAKYWQCQMLASNQLSSYTTLPCSLVSNTRPQPLLAHWCHGHRLNAPSTLLSRHRHSLSSRGCRLRSRTSDVDQLGAHSLFVGMPRLEATPTDDGKMLDITHAGDGFEDKQVNDSQIELHTEQPGKYT